MNAWQMAQQLKHRLETMAWPDGEQALVFGAAGSVAVVAGSPTEDQIPAGFPWAMISIGAATPDPDHPDYLQQQMGVTIAAEVAGDRMGEHAILGGSVRSAGRSAGRGVAEIAYLVRSRIQALTGADGARMIASHTASQPIQMLGRARHVVVLELDVTAWCTATTYYDCPQQLRYAAGAWTWQGGHCSSRYDFQTFCLVRKAGTSPPTTPADGVTVYTGTAAQFTGAASAGNVYCAFAQYGSRGAIEAASQPEVGSYRAV